MGRRFAQASFVALAGIVGCGIDALGTMPVDGGPSPEPTSTSSSGSSSGSVAPPIDAGGDVTVDAEADADANVPVSACKDLPAAWALVAFVSGSDPCPTGYDAGKTELRSGPTTREDTCTCACALATPPVCNRASAGATYDNDNSGGCGLSSSYGWNPAANGGCSTDMWPGPYTTSHDWKFSAPARTGGTCTKSATKHVERLDFAGVGRACVPTAGCEAAPAIPSPAQRCVISDGDVACPAGPFTKRTVYGKTFDVTCGAGTCDCGITGTCSAGTMTFYTANNCTGTNFTMTANGTCQPSTQSSFNVASYKYTATVQNAGCSPTGASTATAVTTTSSATVCCE